MGRSETLAGNRLTGSSLLWKLGTVFLFILAVWHILGQPGGNEKGSLAARQRQRLLRQKAGEKMPWAYMTVVCGEQHAKSAMVLVHSIKSTKTLHDVVVLTRNVSGSTRQVLAALGARVDPQPQPFIQGGDLPLSSIDNLVHGNLSGVPGCFQAKFSMWSMAQYEKVLYLDTPMLVLENIDDIFEGSELSAAPDNDLPDRFNPGLMLIEPSQRTFLGLLREYARLHGILQPPSAQDLLFFNHFFNDWPQKEPEYHLDYGYNAVSRLGYSATWNEWVHPKLKVVHFAGPFERWDDIVDKHYPPTRRYDHLRWEVLRDMYTFLVQQGVVLPSEAMTNQLCQTDYMFYAQGAPVSRKLSVLIHFHGQLPLLLNLVYHYSSMRFVYKIYILPVDKTAAAVAQSQLWNGTRPVEVLDGGNFTASDRLRPIESLATDCVLVCDDTRQVSSTVLQSAFKFWMEHPHRLVGFFPSSHYRNPLTGELVFVSEARSEYSMTSLQLLIMHSDYLQSYTCTLPQAVRDYVDRSPRCEDIALNVLAAQLSGTPPLLVVDNEKRITADALSEGSLAAAVQAQSACLNDLEVMLGATPLRNTTEAKIYLEHDVFTKVEFRDPRTEHPHGSAEGEGSLEFEPIFDSTGRVAGSDENFRFMSSIPRVSAMPEVVVMPSPQQPKRILCLLGNSSSAGCHSGGNCSNAFALSTYQTTPQNAMLLLGTTLVIHSRYGFDDRFHTPNIVANLFYPYPDYGFMKPARAFFYRRGSLEMRLSQWSRLLFKAMLGSDISPFRVRNGDRPVCFERAIMTRRYRPVASERNIVLREAQERAWAYCTNLANRSATPGKSGGQLNEAAWGFSPPPPNTIRVLLLHGDADTGYGVIKNLDELVKGLASHCGPGNGCELLVLGEQNFTNFCQQVLHMGAAGTFITVAGDGTMNHVIFMRQRMRVLELVPFGLQAYDPRVLRVYQEASRWVGLEHSALFEPTGPPCPAQDPSCRFLYRKRPMVVDVPAVLKWFRAVHPPLDGQIGIS